MQGYEQSVFISYAWGGESEELVNQIDQALQQRGLKIIRDKRVLGYKGSISAFMERIGLGNCVIIVISDKYLRSPNCMFELVEIVEGKQFHDRVFPIVLSNAEIYEPVRRLEYVKYWEVKLAELDQAMRNVGQANLQGIREEIDQYSRIRDKISGLTSILKDMNTLTPEMHRDSDFSEIYAGIERRMAEDEAVSVKRQGVENQIKAMPVQVKQSAVYPPGTAPILPGLFVGRDDDITELQHRLTSENHNNLRTVVLGSPGIGKTSLVAKIAYDTELGRVFPDGVLWTAIGQQPNLEAELGNWLAALGLDPRDFPTKETRSNRLAAILRLKKMLLIVDDIWAAQDAQQFLVGGQDCRTLITTRLPQVAGELGLSEQAVYHLLGLSDEASLDLLKERAPEAVSLDPDGARSLTHALEGSPLALQVAGGLLAKEFRSGLNIADLLKELVTVTPLLDKNAPADRIDPKTGAPYTICALLELSTSRLNPITRKRFALLGLFASQPATFDVLAVAAAWRINDPKPTLRELVDLGLVQHVASGTGDWYQMHALLAAHAKSMWPAKRGSKNHFLNLLRKAVKEWSSYFSTRSKV